MTGKELAGAHGAVFDSRAVLKLILEHDAFSKPFFSDITATNPKYTCNPMTLVADTVRSVAGSGKSTTTNGAPAAKKMKTLESFFHKKS
jgi:hypothetical protein